jgi:hypothetical protein
LVPKISLDVIAPISAITGVIVGSILAQRFRKKNLYSDPYINWCVGAYGTIHEFRELCEKIKDNHSIIFPPSDVTSKTGYPNPEFIISHLWEMHREVEKGYKWIGQIEKEGYCAHVAFNKLFDDVDYLWHYLEHNYSVLISPQTTADNFRKILKKIHGGTAKEISEKIANAISNSEFAMFTEKEKEKNKNRNCKFNSDVFETVVNFLFCKIPKPWYKQNIYHE